MSALARTYEQRFLTVLQPTANRLEIYMKECLAGTPRIDRIVARAKSVDRFVEKANRMDGPKKKYDDPLNQIQDQLGGRIIVLYTHDVDTIATEIEKYFRPIEGKTIIPDSESTFGYFGRHYIMLVPRDVHTNESESVVPFCEIQIKTLYQHAWSEANHDLGYKPETALTSDEKRKLAFTSAQSWGADLIFSGLHKEILAKRIA